jgi:hypothetical protein
MKKLKRWYRYVLADSNGKIHQSTNDLYVALSEGIAQNLEVRQTLANITIGKHKIENRFKVLRKITSQTELFQ